MEKKISLNAQHRHFPRNPIIQVTEAQAPKKMMCSNYGIYPDCEGEVEQFYGGVCGSCYNVMSGH